MLVLQRRPNQSVYLLLPDGSEVQVTVVARERGHLRLGFTCPQSVEVWREELVEDRRAELRAIAARKNAPRERETP